MQHDKEFIIITFLWFSLLFHLLSLSSPPRMGRTSNGVTTTTKFVLARTIFDMQVLLFTMLPPTQLPLATTCRLLNLNPMSLTYVKRYGKNLGRWSQLQNREEIPYGYTGHVTIKLPYSCSMTRLLIVDLLLNSGKYTNDLSYTSTMSCFPPPYIVLATCMGKRLPHGLWQLEDQTGGPLQ